MKRKFDIKHIFIVLAIIGVTLRLIHFFTKDSIGLDETFLALNIFEKSFYDLIFTRLENNQVVPFGFMLITKVFVTLFGEGEKVLRVFPLFCGISSVFLYYQLLTILYRKSNLFKAVAFGLFSTLPILVAYSNEFHPYAVDLLAGVLLTLLTIKILQNTDSKKFIRYLGIAGIIFMFLSTASLIVFASNVFVLGLFFLLNKKPKLLKTLLVTCFVWGLFFLANFSLFYSKYLFDDYMLYQWAARFIIDPNTGNFSPRNIIEILITNFNYASSGDYSFYNNKLTSLFGMLLFVFSIVGTIKVVLEKNIKTLLLLVPFAVTILLNLLHIYPFAARHLLYLAPHFLIFTGWGVVQISKLFLKIDKVAQIGFLTIMVLFAIATSIYQVSINFNGEYTRSAVQHVSKNWQAGDFIFVHSVTSFPFTYYLDRDFENITKYGFITRDACEKKNSFRLGTHQYNRVWFLYSVYLQTSPIEDCMQNVLGTFTEAERLDLGKTHLRLFENPVIGKYSRVKMQGNAASANELPSLYNY